MSCIEELAVKEPLIDNVDYKQICTNSTPILVYINNNIYRQ